MKNFELGNQPTVLLENGKTQFEVVFYFHGSYFCRHRHDGQKWITTAEFAGDELKEMFDLNDRDLLAIIRALRAKA